MIPESYLLALADELVATGQFDDQQTAVIHLRASFAAVEENNRTLWERGAPGRAKYREAVERIGSVFDREQP